jgi:hypothetical protein
VCHAGIFGELNSGDWRGFGEVDGLNVSLTAAGSKLAQLDDLDTYRRHVIRGVPKTQA